MLLKKIFLGAYQGHSRFEPTINSRFAGKYFVLHTYSGPDVSAQREPAKSTVVKERYGIAYKTMPMIGKMTKG